MYCKQFESDLKPGWIADEVSMKACKIIRSFSQEIYAKFQANFVVLGDTKIIVVFMYMNYQTGYLSHELQLAFWYPYVSFC